MEMETGVPVSGEVKARVELYGLARLAAGLREVEVRLPTMAGEREVARALARACPLLVGTVLRPDGDGLQEGYALNLGGRVFLASEPQRIQPGDAILLISSQAGG